MPPRLASRAKRFLILVVGGVLAFSTWSWYAPNLVGSRADFGIGGLNEDFDVSRGSGDYEAPVDFQDASLRSAAESACRPKENGLPLVTLVLSAPKHRERRAAIRASWGPEANAVFVVGTPSWTSVPASPEDVVVRREAQTQRDTLLVPGFNDTYRGLSVKTIFGLRWVRYYCLTNPSKSQKVKFLLKVDDDTFINVGRLRKFISGDLAGGEKDADEASTETSMYGKKAFDWRPHRDPNSKYYVPESDYPSTLLPDYLTGPAYLMTTDLVTPLLREHDARMNSTGYRVFPLEDVYVTGILTKRIGFANVVDKTDLFFNEYAPPSRVCPLRDVVSVHRIPADAYVRLHEALGRSEEKCKHITGATP